MRVTRAFSHGMVPPPGKRGCVVTSFRRLGELRNRPVVLRVLANSNWLLFEHGVRWFSGLVVGILLARYLGPAEFGTYRYVLAISAVALALANVGLNSI